MEEIKSLGAEHRRSRDELEKNQSEVREVKSRLAGLEREKTDANLLWTPIEENFNLLQAELKVQCSSEKEEPDGSGHSCSEGSPFQDQTPGLLQSPSRSGKLSRLSQPKPCCPQMTQAYPHNSYPFYYYYYYCPRSDC